VREFRFFKDRAKPGAWAFGLLHADNYVMLTVFRWSAGVEWF
jgi:hypothetical protein